jgi:hypothetical protein
MVKDDHRESFRRHIRWALQEVEDEVACNVCGDHAEIERISMIWFSKHQHPESFRSFPMGLSSETIRRLTTLNCYCDECSISLPGYWIPGISGALRGNVLASDKDAEAFVCCESCWMFRAHFHESWKPHRIHQFCMHCAELCHGTNIECTRCNSNIHVAPHFSDLESYTATCTGITPDGKLCTNTFKSHMLPPPKASSR